MFLELFANDFTKQNWAHQGYEPQREGCDSSNFVETMVLKSFRKCYGEEYDYGSSRWRCLWLVGHLLRSTACPAKINKTVIEMSLRSSFGSLQFAKKNCFGTLKMEGTRETENSATNEVGCLQLLSPSRSFRQASLCNKHSSPDFSVIVQQSAHILNNHAYHSSNLSTSSAFASPTKWAHGVLVCDRPAKIMTSLTLSKLSFKATTTWTACGSSKMKAALQETTVVGIAPQSLARKLASTGPQIRTFCVSSSTTVPSPKSSSVISRSSTIPTANARPSPQSTNSFS